MNERIIGLTEVIAFMDKGEPFDISFVTADTKRGTGGEMKTLTKAVKSGMQKKEAYTQEALPTPENKRKNPSHFENSTRNIHVLGKPKDITKVHLRLITRFNGKRVV
jgi:hypothetical protein